MALARHGREAGHNGNDVGGEPLRINVTAPCHAAVEAARRMPDGGRILVIGSVNGDRIPFPTLSAYATSKSALQRMVRGLARGFGPRGITVNVVQSGRIDTDLNSAAGPMRDISTPLWPSSAMGARRRWRAWWPGSGVREAGFVTGAMHTIGGGFGA